MKQDLTASPHDGPAPAATRRRHWVRWILAGLGFVLLVAAGVITYLWMHSGPHALAPNVAIDRFRRQPGQAGGVDGPPAGVYPYRGTSTETLSVPPKSQVEGPGIPGTVVHRGGCFSVRLDFSDAHWQSWDYCVRDGALDSPGRAGYYNWDFVAFHADDTSTFVCRPPVVTVPAGDVTGRRQLVSCVGHNDKLSTGPVTMHGTSTVTRSGTVTVGGRTVPGVLVTEQVAFSGGQSGTNASQTWFSLATGLPLRGQWRTEVSTPSPFGTSTLRASGTFSLQSLVPAR